MENMTIKINTPAKPAAVTDCRVLLPLRRCSLVYSQVAAPIVNKKLTSPAPMFQ